MFFVCTMTLVTMLSVSCKEQTVILGDPYVDAPTRAMLMEKIAVAYRNVPADTEVVVDFGDGTSPVVTNGPIAVTHQYQTASNTQPDQTYHITVTANGQTVEKRILVYPLRALSYAINELNQPGNSDIWVMAHRANTSDKSIPENSLAAVRACIAAGVEIIETDTHITADGHVVICHDQTITRTTNGSGDITKMTLAQIKEFKLKDRNNNLYSAESIPTLEEFLKECRGKIYVNLDYSPRTASTAEVMKVVGDLDMMDQVLFYCNSAEKVQEVFQFDPEAHAYPWHSNYAALEAGSGTYFVQCSYEPGKVTNVAAALNSGALLTTNMLNGGTYKDVLETYPATRVIQSDVSDELIPKLKADGRR